MKKLITLLVLVYADALCAQDNSSFVVGCTTGKFPFLEYGLGDDRLGGAKMGYLDTNVTLRIVDSVNTDYKVQLSKYHTAYIAKESVQLRPEKNLRPYYLSNNWKVFGDSAFDYVTIQLDERLPYHSHQQINPSRITIDIFGATSNTNWITQLGTTREIRNTWYEQIEDDVLRVYIELRNNQHWGHNLYYDTVGNRLNIRIKRKPPSMDIRKVKIAIDPGHGGDNSGAAGMNEGIIEKEYTLLYAMEFEKYLRKKGTKNVFMTRTKDTTLSMIERHEMLKRYDPDLLISIHFNSSSFDTVQGTSTYYRYIGFRPLSQAVLKRMLELKLKEYGNVGSFNFALSGSTAYPNCLVEVAFLSNPGDEKRVADPKFQKAVARKIYEGIKDWLNSLK
jgi:N-acetylmuramoyl-L-alanine amidase